MSAIVLDTNIVLDLFVYDNPMQAPLRLALDAGDVQWIATGAMRNELCRVLDYPQIAHRLVAAGRTKDEVLAQMSARVAWMEAAPKAPYTCKDPDDQMFIDLACQHQCPLMSKDKAVLAMRSRLARLAVAVTVSLACNLNTL